MPWRVIFSARTRSCSRPRRSKSWRFLTIFNISPPLPPLPPSIDSVFVPVRGGWGGGGGGWGGRWGMESLLEQERAKVIEEDELWRKRIVHEKAHLCVLFY